MAGGGVARIDRPATLKGCQGEKRKGLSARGVPRASAGGYVVWPASLSVQPLPKGQDPTKADEVLVLAAARKRTEDQGAEITIKSSFSLDVNGDGRPDRLLVA